MVSLKSLVVTLLVAQCDATLRSPSAGRRLSQEKIAGYEPRSQVTDHAAIDLDQDELERQLGFATTQSFAAAKEIYENGGFSKSYAEVTIDGGTPGPITQGTEIIGVTDAGVEVRGKAYTDYGANTPVIRVQYRTSDDQSSYVNCQVGALVSASAANLDGCFATNGTMQVSGVGEVSYSYNKRQDNKNGRTLQGFSTGARAKMFDDCPGCPYSDFGKFYEYYGEFEYADKWVQAGFSGSSTPFTNGNNDFSSYSFAGRTEAIKKGTAYMNVFMYVIREMEDALDDCQIGCIDCNDDPVHAWDEAVAFYTGSLVGPQGSGAGNLLYTLANKRCANFKTCGADGNEIEGNSKVNIEIFTEFKRGQNDLINGRCDSARDRKDAISRLMFVPLIQGTLRYAYITATDPIVSEKAEAEGAVFAAAVLPMVHACNNADATKIYDNMKVGSGKADYRAVKSAFEKNYGCMQISCEDVGGLYDDGNMEYYEGMGQCSGGSSNTVGIAVGVTVGVLAVLVLGVFFWRRRSRSASGVDDKFSSGTTGTDVA